MSACSTHALACGRSLRKHEAPAGTAPAAAGALGSPARSLVPACHASSYGLGHGAQACICLWARVQRLSACMCSTQPRPCVHACSTMQPYPIPNPNPGVHQQRHVVALGVAGGRRAAKLAPHRLAPRVAQQVRQHRVKLRVASTCSWQREGVLRSGAPGVASQTTQQPYASGLGGDNSSRIEETALGR